MVFISFKTFVSRGKGKSRKSSDQDILFPGHIKIPNLQCTEQEGHHPAKCDIRSGA
jgi:hypothetical protein